LEELLPKDNENVRLPIVGPLAPSEPAGFPPDQMIRCDECLRANSPTRVNCLYCGSALALTEVSARLRKPSLRPPEKGQPGYNSIFLPLAQSSLADNVLTEAAELLKLTPEDLELIVSARRSLPLSRTASPEEAQLVFERLRDLGLETVTLADKDLGLGPNSVTRVRSIRFDESGITIHQGVPVEAELILWSDLMLLVSGRFVVKKVEVKERKSRKGENEILDTSEFFADEAVVDIYSSSRSQTWRIAAHSFDFSCLQIKTFVAGENLVSLIEVIRTNAPQLELDDSYNSLRQALEPVWGKDHETESSGWRREAPGKYSLGAVTTSTNEIQFTLYSRLRYYLSLNPQIKR